jgi:glucokinase
MSTESSSPEYYVGIDVGGTNVKVGVVSGEGKSLSRVRVRTEAKKGPTHGLENIYGAVERAIADSGLTLDDIRAIGVATPGTMDIPAGMILQPPNLPGWVNIPIRQLVADRFGKPAILQNDANAAAYGEYWVGRARDAHSLVFWTLGTGIGCGIIVADMIIQGEHSHGSECGHIIIEMDNGRLCGTGQYGTLEAYAGAKALVQRCKEALDGGRQSILRETVDRGEEITPLVIAKAAEASDSLADELVMDSARYMGVGTTSLMHTIDPNMVLFGGAMTFGRHEKAIGRRFLERIRDEVKARAFPVPAKNTIIDFATLGNDAGYIGAAGCARRAFGSKK